MFDVVRTIREGDTFPFARRCRGGERALGAEEGGERRGRRMGALSRLGALASFLVMMLLFLTAG